MSSKRAQSLAGGAPSISMRPLNPRNERAVLKARARRAIRHLDWLRGYPVEVRPKIVVWEFYTQGEFGRRVVDVDVAARAESILRRLEASPQSILRQVEAPLWLDRSRRRLGWLLAFLLRETPLPTAESLATVVGCRSEVSRLVNFVASVPEARAVVETILWSHHCARMSLGVLRVLLQDRQRLIYLTRALGLDEARRLASRVCSLAIVDRRSACVLWRVLSAGSCDVPVNATKFAIRAAPGSGLRRRLRRISNTREGAGLIEGLLDRPGESFRSAVPQNLWSLEDVSSTTRRCVTTLVKLLVPRVTAGVWSGHWNAQRVLEAKLRRFTAVSAPSRDVVEHVAAEVAACHDRRVPYPYLAEEVGEEVAEIASSGARPIDVVIARLLESIPEHSADGPLRVRMFLHWRSLSLCPGHSKPLLEFLSKLVPITRKDGFVWLIKYFWPGFLRNDPMLRLRSAIDRHLRHGTSWAKHLDRLVATLECLARDHTGLYDQRDRRFDRGRLLLRLSATCATAEEAAFMFRQFMKSGEDIPYIPTAGFSLARWLAQGSADRFVAVARILSDAEVGYDSINTLLRLGKDRLFGGALIRCPANRTLLRWCQAAHRLASLCKKVDDDRFRPSEQPQHPLGIQCNAPRLASLVADLSRVDPGCGQFLKRLLGPSPEDLAREIDAIERRLKVVPPMTREHLAQRLHNLRWRRRELSPSELDGGAHEGGVRERLDCKCLEWLENAVDRATVHRALHHMEIDLARWPCDRRRLVAIVPHLVALPTPYRRLASAVLAARDGRRGGDLRQWEANARFLRQMRRCGVEMEPWLDGDLMLVERGSRGGRVELALARDPLDVMEMGAPFGTCLSPGGFNFYSAVANAADVNKQVVYGRDENGNVVGRALLCLTRDGAILTFNPYCHDRSLGFKAMVCRFVVSLATAMGTKVASEGEVQCLAAPAWYDDGAIEVPAIAELQKPESVFRRELPLMSANELRRKIAELHCKLSSASLVGFLVGLPEVRARAELLSVVLELADRQTPLSTLLDAAVAAQDAEAGSVVESALQWCAVATKSSARLGSVDAHRLAEILLRQGRPTHALRIMRLTRSRGVRCWTQETDPARIHIVAAALRKVHRLSQASLVQQTGGDCSSTQ